MKKIYFRADAGVDTGYGHFIRTLALADMLKDDFDCVFVTQSPTEYQKSEVAKVCKLVEVPATDEKFGLFLDLLAGDEIVVLDNYFYDTDYQRKIRAKGCKLVCIDDMHDKHYVADVVINHALGVTSDKFSVEPYTQVCLGQSYGLLRRSFLEQQRKEFHPGTSVFVCFGGSDIHNLTQKCVDSVLLSGHISTVYVVVGNAYQHKDQLKQFCKKFPALHVFSELSAEEIAELFRKSDMAIVPASTLLWEALSQKVSCIYGYYVNNQMDICENIGDNEELRMRYVGDFREISVLGLSKIIKQQLSCLDHQECSRRSSTNRISENVRSLFFTDVTVRQARKSDLILYYNWVNDSEVRNSAFNTEPIKLETHKNWFEKKLSDPNSFLYVCYFNSEAIGQVRFDVENDMTVIDISLSKEFRGQGLSVAMLKATMRYFSINTGFSVFHAEVKKDNVASQKLFLKAGFYETTGYFSESVKQYSFSNNLD